MLGPVTISTWASASRATSLGTKRTGGQQALDDRMASLLDQEHGLGSHPGAAVAMQGRQFGQGGQDVQNGQGPGHLLETGDLLPQAPAQVQEEFRLPFEPRTSSAPRTRDS